MTVTSASRVVTPRRASSSGTAAAAPVRVLPRQGPVPLEYVIGQRPAPLPRP